MQTYGGEYGEAVEKGVDEAPGALAAVAVDPCLEGVLELVLKLHQLPPGIRLPLFLPQEVTAPPQLLDEVPLHPLHAALVIRFKGPLDKLEDESTQPTINKGNDEIADTSVPQLLQPLDFVSEFYSEFDIFQFYVSLEFSPIERLAWNFRYRDYFCFLFNLRWFLLMSLFREKRFQPGLLGYIFFRLFFFFELIGPVLPLSLYQFCLFQYLIALVDEVLFGTGEPFFLPGRRETSLNFGIATLPVPRCWTTPRRLPDGLSPLHPLVCHDTQLPTDPTAGVNLV